MFGVQSQNPCSIIITWNFLLKLGKKRRKSVAGRINNSKKALIWLLKLTPLHWKTQPKEERSELFLDRTAYNFNWIKCYTCRKFGHYGKNCQKQ